MVRDGELPHLRSLMERGVYGKLETLEPTVSPVIWTTIATGKRHEQHGIHDFVRPSDGTEAQRLYSRLDRRVGAFWNFLSDAGQRVHVVGWFVTYPAALDKPDLELSEFDTVVRSFSARPVR